MLKTLLPTNFSRFDGLVFTILAGLGLLTGLLVWRGDQVGLRVESVTPVAGAAGVSTLTEIGIAFDQPLADSKIEQPLNITPPVSGTVRYKGRALLFSPATPLTPNTTYTVSLAQSLKSQRGRSMPETVSWQFQTRRAGLLYVAPDSDGIDQLFTVDPLATGSTPTQLTTTSAGVFDYDLSFDGQTIAYAALRPDGGSDLWSIAAGGGQPEPLLLCPEGVCSAPAWAPSGLRLIYERRVMLVEGTAPGPPRLWWLDIATGETVPVFEDNQMIGYGARWSSRDGWFSYVAPSSQGLQVYNVNDGRSLLIPSRMGGLGTWSPQGDSLLVADIQRSEAGFAVHLLKAVPEIGELTDISGDGTTVEDSSPTWSPDGQWIVFTRKTAGQAMGKQLWLMRPDGSEARALTDEPEIHHGFPAWSPGGRYLVYQRFPLKELNVQPQLWLMEMEAGGRAWPVVEVGNRPTWLP